MSSETRISWTGSTWNPWTGCTRVSAGCANCYMFREKARFRSDPTEVRRTTAHTFNSPLRWQREVERGERTGRQRLVFVCSWSDFFHPDADKWRAEAWDIIRRCPGLIFQILTKRPERFAECLPPDWGDGYRNVWLGVTAEDQGQADKRIPILLNTPARLRFVSYEPGLGPIDFLYRGTKQENDPSVTYKILLPGVDWLIVGGESGPGSRPFNIQWARDLRDQCEQAGVAFFFKQLGRHPVDMPGCARPAVGICRGHYVCDCGGLVHGSRDMRTTKDPSSSDPSELPDDLRVQQFPAGWGVEE